MKVLDKPKIDRPREKLARYGTARLSDLELLMAIIGSGNARADVGKIARQVLKLLRTKGGELSYDDLRGVVGLGEAKIPVIVASLELARRYLLDSDQPIIDSPEKAVELLADIRDKKQEYFVCLTLDGANRLIAKRVVTIGTLTASLVHPREVFADAIADRAASIIVAHNHPRRVRLIEMLRVGWQKQGNCLVLRLMIILLLRKLTTKVCYTQSKRPPI